MNAALKTGNLLRRLRVPEGATSDPEPRRFDLNALAGRLVELSAGRSSATLTVALCLVRDAQKEGETAAWVTACETSFFPPDAAALGVDLDALVIVQVPAPRDVARAADKLARSGGFGMVVLDLGAWCNVPMPLLSRLTALAQRHHTAVVCLTENAGSLGSLVSLRAEVWRRRMGGGRFAVRLEVVKDKQRGPGWRHVEVLDGPAGLR